MRSPDFPSKPMTRSPQQSAMEWIRLERQRQTQSEGWSPRHDDEHTDGELLRAAVIYIWHGTMMQASFEGGLPVGWPWEAQWWKPKSRQRNLIRAGALCLAERDRCRRAGLPTEPADREYAIVIRELVALRDEPVAA